MIGVLTGLDQLGKSSLLKIMQDVNPDIKVRKVVAAEEYKTLGTQEAERRAFVEIDFWHEDMGQLIYDRFPFPDEFVYGPISTPPRHTHLNNWDVIEGPMRAHGVKIVYIHSTRHTLDHVDPYVSYIKRPELIARYNSWLQLTQLEVLSYPQRGILTMEDARRILSWLDMLPSDL
jgi:hypothetical protein